MNNNILDPNGEYNFLFLASTIAHLCSTSPITINLSEIKKFWDGDIKRLSYSLTEDKITFYLNNEDNDHE